MQLCPSSMCSLCELTCITYHQLCPPSMVYIYLKKAYPVFWLGSMSYIYIYINFEQASFGHGDASISCPRSDNGFVDSLSLFHSEKAVEELLQQTPVEGLDEHLIEFSETLRSMFISFLSAFMSCN